MIEHWWRHAACFGMDQEIFYNADHRDKREKALDTCWGCPVVVECLSSALQEEAGEADRNRHGIRGGLLPDDRYNISKKGYCLDCKRPTPGLLCGQCGRRRASDAERDRGIKVTWTDAQRKSFSESRKKQRKPDAA